MDIEKLNLINKYMDELKTVKKEIINNSNFITVEKYQCFLNNNQTIKREKILKNKEDGSAAIIYPITKDNEIILSIEPRVFTERTVDIGLPAGYIENEENPINAAKRELLEETGYESDNFISLGDFYQDQGCSSALNHYYIACNCIKVKEQNLDEGEFVKYILVTKEELDWLFDNGYIQGLNSAYTILKAKQYLKR